MDTINVIPFGEQIAKDQKFHLALSNLNIDVKFFRSEVFLASADDFDLGINLFLFDDSCLEEPLQNSVRESLASLSQAINLLVLPTYPVCAIPNDCNLFHDFILWPCSHREIFARIEKFFRYSSGVVSEAEHQQLVDQFATMSLTGTSPFFVKTISLIKKIAHCHAPVLIEGETGTGKENAARAIHYLGERKTRGFVPVNCAAIPDDLLESELFGHVRGAFTDAKTDQRGLIEIADGGTLFLDEVDSLTPKAQAALLRFLQTQEYRPLGGRASRQANVRIMTATNADLKQRVSQKLFREDLYFRLNVLRVVMPPLRERKSDIPLIVDSLLQKFSAQQGIPPKRLSPESLQFLQRQAWPGNVRELENLLLREFLLTEGSVMRLETTETIGTAQSVEAEADYRAPSLALAFQDAKAEVITRFERAYLEQVLYHTRGNVSEAARIAGKERRALGKLIRKYKIDKNIYQQYSL